MFYTDKEVKIYEDYHSGVDIKEIIKSSGMSRSFIFKLVSEIDGGKFPEDKFKTKHINEVLEIRFAGKFLARYEEFEKFRKNKNDVEELRNIISDMLKDGFNPHKVAKFLKKDYKTITFHINNLKK